MPHSRFLFILQSRWPWTGWLARPRLMLSRRLGARHQRRLLETHGAWPIPTHSTRKSVNWIFHCDSHVFNCVLTVLDAVCGFLIQGRIIKTEGREFYCVCLFAEYVFGTQTSGEVPVCFSHSHAQQGFWSQEQLGEEKLRRLDHAL